ncbi:PAS domain S-box protein [Blastopirellula marina]|uniref:histidine kinase n=1 Tax=Blastopirellula marina TaxID=124 RepID=A0A2S8GBZ5_9BACT|nr:PAS domain S-box protein [Blastopirellula marina]PQO41982.1 hypothetical protein C5Y93_26850 [Blastopirellula marina]
MADAISSEDTGEGKQPNDARHPVGIVGIGASAGGLETLKEFFHAMPHEYRLAFVVVQHLSPEHESYLPGILAKHTQLEVSQVEDGIVPQAGAVYVAPPGQDVTMDGGKFRVSESKAKQGGRHPIDHFLRTLARDQKQNAIGIILSGSGIDGARGIREIKECGGMVMVQHPNEAAHDSMPLSAIETRQADYVLPVAKLAEALRDYVDCNSLFDDSTVDPSQYKSQLEEIQHLLKFHAEYDFSHYKHTTLLRRVQRRMGLVGVEDIQEYIHRLKDRPEEVELLAQDLLICVTQFRRNTDVWDVVATEVLTEILRQRRTDRPIRIWIPGCATGEEAYTLAMLLSDAMGDRRDYRVQIFATDISNHALKTARAAIYPDSIVGDVKPEWIRKYFTRDADAFRVTKTIREMIVFASHDLKGDPSFFRLDMISCRNLLIYLDPEAQADILRKFHFALNPNGFLLLGRSETASRYEQGFEAIDNQSRLYRRVGESTPADAVLRSSSFQRRDLMPRLDMGKSHATSFREVAAQAFWKANSTVVLLLNDKLQPVFVGGQSDNFLQIPEGDQRYTIYELVRPGLHLKLRGAITRLESEPEATFENARLAQADGSTLAVRGVVRKTNTEDSRGLIYVQLEVDPNATRSKLEPDPRNDGEVDASGGAVEKVVGQLERELLETREELSTTIEQLEQANEELRAAHEEAMSVNEELQSGTEELEASREELQSLNEELTTLNAQLEDKLAELEGTNNDLDNLISSTRIAVVFLDTEFRVRNFTPKAVDLFSLIRTDVGRPISDLVHKFTDGSFLEDAREVLKQLSPIEREVQAEGERMFIRRLLPYRTHDNRIEGVVATFQDITHLKTIQDEILMQREQLSLVANAMPVLIAYTDKDLRYQFANAGYERWFGLPAQEILGKTTTEVVGEQAQGIVQDQIEQVLSGERVSWEGEVPYRRGGTRYVHSEYIPHHGPDGTVLGFYALIQDISERYESEQALRKSENDFRAIFELAGSGKYQADPETHKFIYTNLRFREITGYNEEELQQRSLSDLTHVDDRQLVDELESSLVLEEGHTVSEFRIVRNDGQLVWISATGTLIRNADGTPRFSIATIQDVTSRVEAEQALRASEERLQIALATAAMGAWEIDLENGKTTWDEQIGEMIGALPEGTPDATALWIDMVHSEDREMVKAAFEAVSQGERKDLNVDFRMPRLDGELHWFTVRGVLHSDNGAQRMLGVLQDITERKIAEQALRESETRFRDLADNIAQLAWICDHTLGEVTWFNRRWYQFTGGTFDDMKNVGWTVCHHPDHIERVKAKIAECGEKEEVWEDTFPLMRYDGVYRWFLSRAVPIRDENGVVVRWFGTNTDITEQMELERALKDADRRKDEFLAMLAHELRNPLAPIRSGIDLLMMDPQIPKETLEVMEEQVRHLVRLVDDLLDVSRITRGKVDLRRQSIQLQRVILKAVSSIRPYAVQKNISMSAEPVDETIWLDADPVRLAQIFENLLVNSVKYTETGGDVWLATERAGDEVIVRVKDNGIGIDEELMPHVFELFAQSSRSVDREPGGLGIGLTIVKSLAELHEGKVEVFSEGLGKGSEFSIRLPVLAEPPQLEEAKVNLQAGGAQRVLIVDDNKSARYLLSRLMASIGKHSIQTAADGKEAIALFNEHHPTVVLLDIGLPEMDGYEVAQRLRAVDPDSETLLVAVTGYGQNEDRLHAQAAGFDLHLVKPIGVDELREILAHPKLAEEK